MATHTLSLPEGVVALTRIEFRNGNLYRSRRCFSGKAVAWEMQQGIGLGMVVKVWWPDGEYTVISKWNKGGE